VRPPFVGSVVIVLRTDSKNRRRCAIVRYVSVRLWRGGITGDYRERPKARNRLTVGMNRSLQSLDTMNSRRHVVFSPR
jgi:hypothetical protein